MKNIIEDIQDDLHDALATDLEHGVAWMNDKAWEQWRKDYPTLSRAIQKILDLETEKPLDETA
jgi:hypothetical protein